MIRAGKLCFVLCALAVAFAPVRGEQSLAWHKSLRTVDASADDWELRPLLARVAALSGWRVYAEPELDEKVTAHFTNLPRGEALKLLLGDVNYALVPGPGGRNKLYVYKTSLTEATTLVAADGAKRATNWLAKEIILTLPPGSKLDAEKLASELGGKVIGKSDGLNAYRLEFPDAARAQSARDKLASHPELDAQDNYAFNRPSITSTASSSPASIFPVDPTPVTQGSQVTVALVDTAIQPIDGKMKDFILPSVNVMDQPTSLPTDPTHATSMAETLLNSMTLTQGAGPDSSKLGSVRVLPIDIYGSSETTTTFEVAEGLYKAIQANAQIVNLSLGGTGESPMVDYLLDQASQKNMLVFASAGNTPTTDLTWPAANPTTIAVTATDWRGDIASYANRGPFVDVAAPGSSEVSFNGQRYISTGTSTATAFVSGQAAGLAAQGLSAEQARQMILNRFNVNRPGVK
jgi:hypothetical protein